MSFSGSQHGQAQQTVPFKTSKQSLKEILLHGNLDIWVRGAKNLPNMDTFHESLREMCSSLAGKVRGKIEKNTFNKITSDPYVTVSIQGAVIGRTFVISNSEDPVWMQHFHVPVAHYAAEVHFVVKDNDIVGSQLIGAVGIPVEQLVLESRVEGSFPILGENGEPCKPGAVLSLSIQYTPMEKLGHYHQGVGAGPTYVGVPGTYFGLRKGGQVTLYQDAHVHKDSLPNVWLEGNLQYDHASCWRDIFDAISQARRLVYITGWSVFHNVRLVRDADDEKDYMLGNLLKSKSQEGVRVLLLVWDDPSSLSLKIFKKEGIMHTNDEVTRRFFKHSSVQVLLCPRSARKGHSWLKRTEAKIYTHHQKTVIVDADAGNNKRKLIAFVGGLDLFLGRYDTPSHPIFRTLETVHKGDYYNSNFKVPSPGCPRQPWHDLHCRIDGPAVYDILTNFEERWLHASERHGIQKLKSSHHDQLLKLERVPDILRVSDVSSRDEDDREGWHVQVFRSIDSNSVNGFPDDPKDATGMNLVCGKNIIIDTSIQTAYINAIRAAQHFIYIENQYFLGSSYNWDSSYSYIGANNLIPMEIALKIASKIKANQRFSAYVIIPMWPEGDPTSDVPQAILFWQRKTMEMMYSTIYQALEEVGVEKEYEPQDFLAFFCLGTREAPQGPYGECSKDIEGPPPPKAQELAKKNRRFMIYVHSKGMIVDDEYLILGSANINQRSLEGSRDTEIAIGAYQPHHTYAKRGCYPKGQIHGYRMSLWAEHLGFIEECFNEPESLECMRRVRSLGELNWKQYVADEVVEMKGHLLKYPLLVDRTGEVKPIPGCETFPDVGGNVKGTFPTTILVNLTI